MPELKINDENERSLVLSALISHAHRCRDIINLHKETKDALKENALNVTAEKAQREFHDALTMIAKYYGIHLGSSKFYCLNCAPSEGAEHDRMSEAEFARWNECSNCGLGAYYFVSPEMPSLDSP
jgi:hypothetical protein